MFLKSINSKNAFLLVHNIHFQSNELYITEVGYSSPAAGRKTGPRVLDTYLAHFILSGECTFNGEVLHPGDGYLVCPNQKYEFIVGNSPLFEHCWLMFNGNSTETLLKTLNMEQLNHKFTFSSIDELKSSIFLFFNISGKTNISSNHMLGIFFSLLSHINIPDIYHVSSRNLPITHVNNAIKYINANLHDSTLSLVQIATCIHLSPKYLSRIFSEYTQVSIQNHIINTRIERAKKLLADSELKIYEISSSVGYDDNAYSFTQIFKKHVGMTPTEYRNSKYR